MAARIAGVNIPMHKHIRIGLRAVFGIGPTLADKICQMSGVSGDTKVKDLTEQQLDTLRSNVDGCKIEGDLRREISLNIKRKMDLGTYEGRRHRSGLPLRKRTKTNARTRKGKRKPIK